jgi:hypothetical protein
VASVHDRLAEASGRAHRPLHTLELIPGEQPMSFTKVITCIRWPLLLVTLNFGLGFVLWGQLPGSWGTACSLSIRLGSMIWAGYLVARTGQSGLWGAALAGALVMFMDHVLLKGGGFLLMHAVAPETIESISHESLEREFDSPMHAYLMAFGGVLVSYIMFLPFDMLLGFLGGLAGRTSRRRLAS